MAEPAFARSRFFSRLGARRLGRTLVTLAETASTNDEAWAACAAGAPHGTTVVAEAQTRGRGRAGRAWHTAPGKALAISVALHRNGRGAPLGLVPLAAGLAVARALERLGAAPSLKWPNDVLLGGRKVAGVLCESRRLSLAEGGARGPGALEAVVVGVGVNVLQAEDDFPAALAGSATSLAREGVAARREEVAAAFLDALEPLWEELERGSRGTLLEEWSARATFWGRPVTARTPVGEVRGEARALTPDGALRLVDADGAAIDVLAGDLSVETGS